MTVKRVSTPNRVLRIRLPLELREAVIDQARVKGDLARIVLFALRHVERESIPAQANRKYTELALSPLQQIYIGIKARAVVKEWAEEEDISVNSLIIHVLTTFFKALKRDKALQEELKLELRAMRGIPITD